MASDTPAMLPMKPPDPFDGVASAFAPTDWGKITIVGKDNSNTPAISYARDVTSSNLLAGSSQHRPTLKPRFPSISLPARQVGAKNGLPAISFTSSEIGACEKLFEHSIVAKFMVGRPQLSEIHRTFASHWAVAGRASISEIWDSRHILIIFDSEEDVRVALSSPFKKVGHAFFRLFRWSADYNPKREFTVTTVWVRLPNLPLYLYEKSYIEVIVSTFGYFVSIDERTKACTSLRFARACVELAVTKPIPKSIWINLPDNRSF